MSGNENRGDGRMPGPIDWPGVLPPASQVQQVLERQRELLARPLTDKLADNLEGLRELFRNGSDVVIHEFFIKDGTVAALIYIDGISDIREMDMHILSPLQNAGTGGATDWVSVLARVSISSHTQVRTLQEAVDQVTFGDPVLLMDGAEAGFAFSLQQWNSRAIEEPEAETVVRGPREGFVETLRLNTAMVRRRLQTPALKLKPISIGRYTKTSCVIAYLEGVTDPKLVEEMETRLRRIDIDGVYDSNVIEEMIEDNPLSPFPQLQTTERPDVVCANLLEGRVALMINGTPFTLIAPTSLFSLMQSPEDYYQRWFVSTPIRWIRMMFAFIAVFMPSIYIAVLSFHQEMVPTTLLLTIAKSREQIPFPALVEALLMEVTFEALREAGVRLPKQVGAAVSIVGALVIGQAAIAAGIVSSPMIMVVAITGVASFLIPNYSLGIALRLTRFPIMICAGVLGLYGIVLAALLVLIHMMTLRSFGVPYLSPVAPLQAGQLSDTLLRKPRWMLKTRPHFTRAFWNRRRLGPSYPGKRNDQH
ncbi:spore germination protein [Paenibacillus thailandensis]|uniref:Spore germination protein n=1 Tax=Paenibacillus thailandensis TaxID=393250 RepID=A0ABW5R1N1_9BACL